MQERLTQTISPPTQAYQQVHSGLDDKGPMALMLKARANYESSHPLMLRQRSPPRGGFDLDADNQQFLMPSEDDCIDGVWMDICCWC